MLPKSKRKLSRYEAEELVKRELPGMSRYKQTPILLFIRGYYLDTMGVPGENDRGIYDDAAFIMTPVSFHAFNANVDPSIKRAGEGTGENKGIANIVPGAYFAHTLDLHNNDYLAVCQRLNKVAVMRDGDPPYRDVGYFGINVHRGGTTRTGSLGCLTIPPTQWDEYISSIVNYFKSEFGNEWDPLDLPMSKRPMIPIVVIDEIKRRNEQ